MASNHTPRPWNFEYDYELGMISIKADSGMKKVGEACFDIRKLGYYVSDIDEAMANAKLMKLAPEMLDACQKVVEYFKYGLEDIDSSKIGFVSDCRKIVNSL